MGPSGKWIEGICPDGSVEDAARRSLDARLTTVIHWLPLAAYHAQQEAEHVHRLRVSTRRAAAALGLYRDWLPRQRARWFGKRLKKIRRAAGTARDLDVLAIKLARQYGEQAAPVLTIIAEQREAVQPDILKIAERLRRDDRFVRKTAKLIESIRPPKSSGDSANALCFRDWAAVQLAGVAEPFFAAVPNETADMAALHEFRIRAKALRYAIELLAKAFGPQLRGVHYPVVEELQERLGRINDHVAARDRLCRWAAEDQHVARKTVLCELAEHETASLAGELRNFRGWWTPSIVQQLSHDLAHSG